MSKRVSTIVAALALLATVCLAGERFSGKYSGVVIFDRWGGCTLYSGIYVMYISEGVKEQLRPEAGKCVRIDATTVEQPRNPGDGLIKKFDLLGPAPAARESESPEGLKLTVARAFEDGNAPEFTLRVENDSDKPRTLHMDSLAPTVLAAKATGGDRWGPSDGPSSAVVTRQSFWSMHWPRLGAGLDERWPWKVVVPQELKPHVSLDPKAVFELRLSFTLPAGEYEFLAGYGGGVHAGQCIASNLIGFDVKQDGTAVVAKVAGR